MTESEARDAITRWARSYYRTEGMAEPPTVAVVSISHDKQMDEWEAELSVSSSADNPHVGFWMDDQRKLHVDNIEY